MKINGYELNLSEEQLDDILNKMRPIEFIGPEFEGYERLSTSDKQALEHLVKAADIINDVFLEQDHPMNRQMQKALFKLSREVPVVAKAYEVFKSLNGVAGLNGIDPEPIEIFKGLKLLKGRNFYPEDLSVEEFHAILLKMFERGQIDEIKKILSQRTMVRRDKDVLKAIDYTVYFEREFSLIANELEVAAHYTSEHEFEDFLSWQAQALLQTSEDMDMLADKHWALLENGNLEFTISRENYEDEMTSSVFENKALADLIKKHNIEVVSKDSLGARVGIVNKEGTDLILQSKQTLAFLASKMPMNKLYQQNINQDNIKQAMVDVDLMALTGDYAACRGGITTAQNLPNNDKLAVKTGGGRRNVYHRQVRMSEDKERTQKLLNILLDEKLHPYYDTQARHLFVIGHENGHSLGPNSEYQTAMGKYQHIIEEHKANVISVTMLPEIKKQFGLYDDAQIKKIYTTWIVSLFLRAKPVLAKPHRMADLIEFNYLLENGAIQFNKDKKLEIDFEKLPLVLNALLEETIKVQLSKSVQAAEDFVSRWALWSEWPAYIASVQKELGIKPYIALIRKF